MNEKALFYDSILDPEVLDLRDQYPLLDRQRLRRYLENPGLRIPRSLVPTFDLVQTRINPNRPAGIGYLAINVSPVSELGVRVKRFDREERFCEALEWEWRIFTDRERVDQRSQTASEIVHRLKNLDVEDLRQPALDLAPSIRRHARPDRTLREVSQLVAKNRPDLSPQKILDLIAVAAIYGFLPLDLNRPLRKCSPLYLCGDVK